MTPPILPTARISIFIGAAIFLMLAALHFWLGWNPVSAGFLSDDAVYLLMADGFSPFHHSDSALRAYILRQSIFPPGYPILLALLGGGSDELLWSHVLTTTTFLIALICLWRWIADVIRDDVSAMGPVVVFALLPGTLMQDMELMSEFPYLMFTFAAIWNAAREDHSQRSLLLAAICTGLAAATRSAGISLIIALAIWLLAKRRQRRTVALLLAVAPTVAWIIYKNLAVVNQGAGYSQFWSQLLTQLSEQGLSFVPRYVIGQLIAMWHGLLMNLDFAPSVLTTLIAGALMITAVPIFIRRLRRWKLDALYFAAATVITLLYPFPEHFTRLIIPLIPLVLAYSYFCVRELTAERVGRSHQFAIQHAWTTVLLAVLFPALSAIAFRSFEPIAPALTSWKHTTYWFQAKNVDDVRAEVASRQRIVDASRGLRDYVPEGECVTAIRTALTMLYGHRVVQQPPPPSQTGEEVLDKRLHNCPSVFLLGVPGHVNQESVDAYYPSDRLAPDAMQFVQIWNDPTSREHPVAILLRTKGTK